MSLEQQFTAKFLDRNGQSQDIGGKPGRVLQMYERWGAVLTCKKLLRTPNTQGRERIAKEKQRPDLSIEALVLIPEFASLFTKAEIACAVLNLQQIPGGEDEGWRQWVKP
jgi:hypothetical protein